MTARPRPSSCALSAGMRALITCDSGEVVAGIVDFVVSQHAGLRLLSRALARAEDGPLAVVLIVLNGLRCYVGVYPEGQGSAVVAARRLNERRAVAALKQMMPERQWTELVFAWRFVHVARAIPRLSRTILRDCTRTVKLARLDYGLAIVECEASRHIYEAAACRMDYLVVKSRKRDWSPMRVPVLSGGLQVGVFLSKDPVEERVVSCVQALLTDVRVTDVRVRPHPVNLWPGLAGRIASFGDNRVRLLSAQSLDAGLRECDLLLAGNSTVLLDALVAGCPACYVRGLDHGPYDVQGFVRDGLVCELAQPSAIDYDAIAGFYRRDGWPRVLRHYADIDRDDIEVGQAVRAAVKGMIADDRYERGVA